MQALKLGVPTSPLGIAEYHHVLKRGITVDWRGRLMAPEGSLDAEGCIVPDAEAHSDGTPPTAEPQS